MLPGGDMAEIGEKVRGARNLEEKQCLSQGFYSCTNIMTK
jgi:hypothetical protein